MSQLVSIQVLRALAALAVALLHALNDASAIRLLAAPDRAAPLVSPLPLAAGVDLFFVISGFVMVYASLNLFGTASGPRRFLIRRISRVVPLYWLTTTAFLAIALIAPSVLNSERITFAEIVGSYLFVPMMRGDGTPQPVYSLGWTLNYEMFFYVIFAACIWRPRAVAVGAAASLLLGLTGLGLMAPGLDMPLAFWTHNIILEFVFGMALAYAYIEGFRLRPAAGALLIACGVAMLHLDLTAAPREWLRGIAWGVPAALVLAGAVFADYSSFRLPGAGLQSAVTRAFVAVGDASYALYLTHPFAMRALKQAWLKLGLAPVVSPWLYIVVTLGLAVAMSLAIYRWLERPITAALKERFDRAPPLPA